jgi:hypothetical protein
MAMQSRGRWLDRKKAGAERRLVLEHQNRPTRDPCDPRPVRPATRATGDPCDPRPATRPTRDPCDPRPVRPATRDPPADVRSLARGPSYTYTTYRDEAIQEGLQKEALFLKGLF